MSDLVSRDAVIAVLSQEAETYRTFARQADEAGHDTTADMGREFADVLMAAVVVVAALPAMQPRVKPLEWREISGFEDRWFADADIGVYSVSDPTGRGRWRWQWHIHNPDRDWDVLLGQSNQELARAFPTREDAIAAVEGHRKARILSALDNNNRKEVMPSEPNGSAKGPRDIGPGDQAVAGAAPWPDGLIHLTNTRRFHVDCATEGCGRRVSTRFEESDYCEPCGREAAALNPRKEVMPIASKDPANQSDIGPGDQAVAGAAQIKVAWPEDAKSLLAEADSRIAWESLGFGADFAERVEAALESDPPEEIGILQARLEGQDREWADLTRQLQGQPRRQSDVNAGGHPTESQIASACLSYRHDFGLLSEPQRELIMFQGLEWLRAWRREFSSLPKPVAALWQPIATAPKDRVIDLWSAEGGRYPDAIWDVSCGGVEGWDDANDHRSLEDYSFTHWMDRPAGPTEGDSHE